jgi:hypothetical protein
MVRLERPSRLPQEARAPRPRAKGTAAFKTFEHAQPSAAEKAILFQNLWITPDLSDARSLPPPNSVVLPQQTVRCVATLRDGQDAVIHTRRDVRPSGNPKPLRGTQAHGRDGAWFMGGGRPWRPGRRRR